MLVTPSLSHCSNKYELAREGEKDKGKVFFFFIYIFFFFFFFFFLVSCKSGWSLYYCWWFQSCQSKNNSPKILSKHFLPYNRRQYSWSCLYKHPWCLQSNSPPHVGQSDHLSLFLLPKYAPIIKRVKPTVRTVKVWLEEADSSLQQEFQNTDWNLFASRATLDSHTDVNTYTSSVLHHNRCVEKVTTHKVIKMYPNQKPWMNKEVRLLLKTRDTAFKSGFSRSSSNLKQMETRVRDLDSSRT